MTPPGYVLAFDFGLRHIGVAAGQTVTGTASPVTTLRAVQGRPDWRAVGKLVSSWTPLRLLVGLPLNMDGSDSEMSQRAAAFAEKLERRTGVPVTLVDERLTTREARERLRNARGRRTGTGHAQAAVLIAETWLGEPSGKSFGDPAGEPPAEVCDEPPGGR
jgi:putative holliday junction resolvase